MAAGDDPLRQNTPGNTSGNTRGSTSGTNPGNPNTSTTGAHSGNYQQSSESFVHSAWSSGEKEIRVSQLALRKAQQPEVRALAQTIVNDHTRANEELKQIAMRKGIDIASLTNTGRYNANAQSTRHAGGTTAERGQQSTAQRENSNVASDNTSRTDSTTSRSDSSISRTDGSNTQTNRVGGDHSADSLRQLETVSDGDFDRQYISAMARGHHKAIAEFESAAKMGDSDIKEFASKTLPTLRRHQEEVQRIAQTKGWNVEEGNLDRSHGSDQQRSPK